MIVQQSGTTTASVVDTVTFTVSQGKVDVVNNDAATSLWYTDNGTTPVIGGPGAYEVAPKSSFQSIPSTESANTNIVVKLISSAAVSFSVEILPFEAGVDF